MRLYGINLPEPKPGNTSAAIKIARDIHQREVNRRSRNTRTQKWDKYWVEIYNIVLTQLNHKRE